MENNVNVNEAGAAGAVRNTSNLTGAVTNSMMQSKKVTEEPVVLKDNKAPSVRFVTIGIGQGGCKIATTLTGILPNKPFEISINTSDQDLAQVNIPDNQKFKIGGTNANGAGKNRDRAKQYFKSFAATSNYSKESLDVLSTFIGLYEEVLFNPKYQTVIIVSFTSDGGSGSGLGPMFTASLTNYVNSVSSFRFGDKDYTIDDVTNSIPRPVVIAVTPKCKIDAGATSLQNAIECAKDIQTSIDAGIGTFFIADNNLDESVSYKSTEEMYNIINSRIAAPLLKFLGIEMNSDIKCMDLQDKINTLRIPGACSFISVSDVNLFQYVIPHGQSVTRAITMLKYDGDETAQGEREASAKNLMRKLDVSSVDDISVFFQIDKSMLNGISSVTKELLETSMIGLFGFKSLSAIIEELTENLHRTLVANDKKQNVITNNSTGFDSIKKDSAELNNRFGGKTLSQASVSDLF